MVTNDWCITIHRIAKSVTGVYVPDIHPISALNRRPVKTHHFHINVCAEGKVRALFQDFATYIRKTENLMKLGG